VGNQGHGTLWISLDGARSSPFLAEFIDAPAISSKSALVIILAKAKGKILLADLPGIRICSSIPRATQTHKAHVCMKISQVQF
jgi:hypothetical protein